MLSGRNSQGGFQGTESQDVPKPRGLSGGVNEMLQRVGEEVVGLTRGELPRTETIALLSASFLVCVVLLMVLFSSGKPPARPGSSRPKAD